MSLLFTLAKVTGCPQDAAGRSASSGNRSLRGNLVSESRGLASLLDPPQAALLQPPASQVCPARILSGTLHSMKQSLGCRGGSNTQHFCMATRGLLLLTVAVGWRAALEAVSRVFLAVLWFSIAGIVSFTFPRSPQWHCMVSPVRSVSSVSLNPVFFSSASSPWFLGSLHSLQCLFLGTLPWRSLSCQQPSPPCWDTVFSVFETESLSLVEADLEKCLSLTKMILIFILHYSANLKRTCVFHSPLYFQGLTWQLAFWMHWTNLCWWVTTAKICILLYYY